MSNEKEIEERVIAKIRQRRDAGRIKYGTTMERNDLSFAQWLKHLQEELMDAAIYVEKLIREHEQKENDTMNRPAKTKRLVRRVRSKCTEEKHAAMKRDGWGKCLHCECDLITRTPTNNNNTESLLAKIKEMETKNEMLIDLGNRMAEILERLMLDQCGLTRSKASNDDR